MIAEETVADLEKEKTMKDLEYKDNITKFRNEVSSKDNLIQQLRDRDQEKGAAIDHHQKVCLQMFYFNTEGLLLDLLDFYRMWIIFDGRFRLCRIDSIRSIRRTMK